MLASSGWEFVLPQAPKDLLGSDDCCPDAWNLSEPTPSAVSFLHSFAASFLDFVSASSLPSPAVASSRSISPAALAFPVFSQEGLQNLNVLLYAV